jgi:hypothetical protein
MEYLADGLSPGTLITSEMEKSKICVVGTQRSTVSILTGLE